MGTTIVWYRLIFVHRRTRRRRSTRIFMWAVCLLEGSIMFLRIGTQFRGQIRWAMFAPTQCTTHTNAPSKTSCLSQEERLRLGRLQTCWVDTDAANRKVLLWFPANASRIIFFVPISMGVSTGNVCLGHDIWRSGGSFRDYSVLEVSSPLRTSRTEVPEELWASVFVDAKPLMHQLGSRPTGSWCA